MTRPPQDPRRRTIAELVRRFIAHALTRFTTSPEDLMQRAEKKRELTARSGTSSLQSK